MCTHLAKVGATYYFRMAVPAELRPFLLTKSGKPRTEFMESLGTKDRDTAKRLLPDRVKLAHAELDAARIALAREQAQEGAAEPASAVIDANLAAARAAHEARLAAQQKRRAEREPYRQELRALMQFSTAEMAPRDAAMRDLLVERAGRMIADEPVALEPRQASAVPLLDLFDEYAKGGQLKPNTARDWRRVLAKLVKFLGHDDAARITDKDVRGWRDVLLKVPDEDTGKVRSHKTVGGTYLTALRATLQWGLDEGRLSGNAAAGVKVRQPKAARLRESQFTDEEAAAILKASLLPIGGKLSEGYRLARRWIPWLLAYTGARVNEISQLRGEDIIEVDGITCLRITPEAGTVKDNQARLVPVHPHLIEQGFLRVAKESGGGPIFYDPNSRRVEGDASRHFKKVGEHLAHWVREEVGIKDRSVSPNHGWRHLFKFAMLKAGVDPRVADAIQGHAPKTAGERYGSVPLETKRDAIEKLLWFSVD